jgi:hypothetical protein
MDMLTEKAIADSSWCPMLWRDKKNETKRVKEGRDWDPMEGIQKVLVLGMQSKSAILKESGFQRKAIPYGQEFWIHIPTIDSMLLVTAKELVLNPTFGDDKKVTLLREPRYDPRVPEQELAEKHLHHLIRAHLKEWFNVPFHEVVTNYPKSNSIVTTETSSIEMGAAQSWASEMQNQFDGSMTLVPRLDRCFSCFWKDCPARSSGRQPPIVNMPKGRNQASTSMD